MNLDPLRDAETGDEIVYDGVSYFFTRKTPDDRTMAVSSQSAMLEIPDPDTGFPTMPNAAQILSAMAARRLFLRSAPLRNPVRAAARAEEPATAELYQVDDDGTEDWTDPQARLRRMVVRAWDALPDHELPYLSEHKLPEWVNERFGKDSVAAIFGRTPCATTLRTWINERGAEGDRRAVDMPSRSGKVARSRRFPDTVIELGRLHAIAQVASSRPRKVGYGRFKRDLKRVSRGEPVEIGGRALAFPRPTRPFKPYGTTTFAKECGKARSHAIDEAKYGPGGRKANFGGGGFSEMPGRYLQVVQQDDSPFSKWFVVDLHNRVPVGQPNVVISLEIYCRVVLGWDDSFENPSTSTWMRALAHCGIPKTLPASQPGRPELAALYGHIRGAVVYDNARQYVGRAAEDASGDLAHAIKIAGEGEPTHKALVERVLQTLQGYMREIPPVDMDVKLMRRFGYDPRKHVVVTIEDFRDALAEAIATYHLQPHDGLGGRCPLDVWTEQVSIHGHDQAKDVDQYLRSIGDVHYEVEFSRTGLVVNDLPYSLGTEGNEQLMSDLATVHGAVCNAASPTFKVKAKSYDRVDVVSVFNPMTRRYLEVPCTRRRYSDDLLLSVHRLVRTFATEARMAFATDEEMLDARTAFSDYLEQRLPQASARERRIFGRLVDQPNVQRFLGSAVVRRFADASASGMAEDAVPHEGRSATRRDTHEVKPRPARSGVNAQREERVAQAEERAVVNAARAQTQRRQTRPRTTPAREGRKATPRSKPKIAPLRPGSFA